MVKMTMSDQSTVHPFRRTLSKARRLVVKVGSGVLVNQDHQLDDGHIRTLVEGLSDLLKSKIQVVLVSSGAIAAGAPVMGLVNRARSIPQKQACAAVGQTRLMALYERLFSEQEHHTAQILLTQDDVRNRERYLNAKNTFETLLLAGILPIVNENDTVVVEEIKFGDNDSLSAQVAALVQADLLLMLSSVSGFYAKDPAHVREGDKPLAAVERIREDHFRWVRDRGGPTSITSGGMQSKLAAIQKAAQHGIPSVLVDGRQKGVIERVLRGQEEGTLFLPEEDKLSARKHWILHSLSPQGSLSVDEGAVCAIVQQGRSLLPIGITTVSGEFGSGVAVQVVGPDGSEIARGLTHYSASEVRVIQGAKSDQIESLLGYSYYEEVIHRDNLVLVK